MRRAASKARAALVVVLIGLSVADLLFGRDAGSCRVAYLHSGLSRQQLTLGEFRESYADSICARGGPNEADGLGEATSGALPGGRGSA